MRLGKTSGNGVFATVHIAGRDGHGPVQGREVAEARGLPQAHLLKILQQLVRAGVLRSERGPQGGFSLRKPAHEITLLEIVEAIDGPITGTLGSGDQIVGMAHAKELLEQTFCGAAASARELLAGVTIADLMDPAPEGTP